MCPHVGIDTCHLSILKHTNIHFYRYKKTYVYCVLINKHKYMFLYFPIILPNAFQHLVLRVWGTSSNVANGSEAHAHIVISSHVRVSLLQWSFNVDILLL